MKKTFFSVAAITWLITLPAFAQMAATTTLNGTLSTAQDRTTGVTAGTYTCPTETVDATGRVTAISNGTCSGGGASARTFLTANQNYYFNCSTGSDTTGDGTSTNPWATPVKAWQVAQQTLDLAGQFEVIANSQAACSNVNWSFTGNLPPGNSGLGSFVIEGATFSGIVQGGNGPKAGLPQINFDNASYTPDATPAGQNPASYGMNFGNGQLIFTGTTILNSVNGTEFVHVVGPQSFAAFSGTVYLSSGGAMYGIGNAEDGAVIFPGYWGANWIFNGSPVWSQFAFQADYNGVVDWSGATCSGGYTGPASRGLEGGQVLFAATCP